MKVHKRADLSLSSLVFTILTASCIADEKEDDQLLKNWVFSGIAQSFILQPCLRHITTTTGFVQLGGEGTKKEFYCALGSSYCCARRLRAGK